MCTLPSDSATIKAIRMLHLIEKRSFSGGSILLLRYVTSPHICLSILNEDTFGSRLIVACLSVFVDVYLFVRADTWLPKLMPASRN